MFTRGVVMMLMAGTLLMCRQKEDVVLIACAANLYPTVDSLLRQSRLEENSNYKIIYGSSGSLTNKILSGAPYDLFLSADEKYPEKIFDSGLACLPPRRYATGQLVVWTARDSIPMQDLGIRLVNMEKIAIANPETAPYGRAAVEVLQALGIFDSLSQKLVFAQSIGQVNQFVTSGAVDVGFTSLSSVSEGVGSWHLIDSALYLPIYQKAILIKDDGECNEAAILFYNFLFSDEARKIFENFGYIVYE